MRKECHPHETCWTKETKITATAKEILEKVSVENSCVQKRACQRLNRQSDKSKHLRAKRFEGRLPIRIRFWITAIILLAELFYTHSAFCEPDKTPLSNLDFQKSDMNALIRECDKNATAYFERKMFKQAIDECDKGINLATNSHSLPCNDSATAQLYLKKGDSFASLKDYQSAIIEYQEVCACDFKYFDDLKNRAHVRIGESFYHLANYTDAARAYSKALEGSLGNMVYGIHFMDARTADTYFRTGDIEKSAKLFHKAVAANLRDGRRPVRYFGSDTDSKLDELQNQIDLLKWRH